MLNSLHVDHPAVRFRKGASANASGALEVLIRHSFPQASSADRVHRLAFEHHITGLRISNFFDHGLCLAPPRSDAATTRLHG